MEKLLYCKVNYNCKVYFLTFPFRARLFTNIKLIVAQNQSINYPFHIFKTYQTANFTVDTKISHVSTPKQ